MNTFSSSSNTSSRVLALPSFPVNDIIEAEVVEAAPPDLVAMLLNDKRSADTRRAYAADLRDFFDSEPTPGEVAGFVAQEPPQIALRVLEYKRAMLARGLSEATVNRRLAAIRSLLKFAHRLGMAKTDGRNLVDGEKVRAYRDTRGVDVKTLKKLLAAPEKAWGEKARAELASGIAKEHGAVARLLRDLAILTLLIENALRRAELCKLNALDFDPATRSLWILGKGHGSQKERITLSPNCVNRIDEYSRRFPQEKDAPLFRNFDHRAPGARLTPDGLYSLMGEYARLVGLGRLTPHQLRHSAITAALDATKGDVRRVQKLSRHAKIETLMLYDDARNDAQGEVSDLLSGLLSSKR